MHDPEQYFLQDDGTFPNSDLPVLIYKNVLDLRGIFPSVAVKKQFRDNNWGNNWEAGIFTFHHYHSTAHEVLGITKGSVTLLLGGPEGLQVDIEAGDVIIVPAGVAHKNTGKENDVTCVGGYYNGRQYDMNYGKPDERPNADRNIALLPTPATDPISGLNRGLPLLWRSYVKR